MKFVNAIKEESRHTLTENGADAYNTTNDFVLDMFGSIGSLRVTTKARKERIFADAFNQDPLLATRCLFYARDVRGGLGERDTFRTLLTYAAKHHPEAVRPNIGLVGFYGRYDDLYCLVGTELEPDVWAFFKEQLELDEKAMKAKKPVSLLAKWLKTPDASSPTTKKLGIKTAKGMGLTVYIYKRKLRALRKYLRIVEVSMSANQWDKVEYAKVPSRAMMIYRKAFEKHDGDRYQKFLRKVEKGEEKINAATLFPYDLVGKYIDGGSFYALQNIKEDATIEAQWKNLPDYVGTEANALVIADVSGSMSGRPLCTSLGLAIYFAERNRGQYHGLWMAFSEQSHVHQLKGETLAQKIESIDYDHWGMNTNLEAAFMRVLKIGVDYKVAPEDMVKSLIIVSDMEIDRCACCNNNRGWSFYDKMKAEYRKHGFQIPNVVFWNCNSRSDVFHADKDRKGVQLCSGQSASTFKQLMACVGMSPVEMMKKVLNGPRYAPVSVEGIEPEA